MQEVIERVRQVAPTDLCVLITGESGTGKEVFARAIHSLSKRRKERLVSLNCGAIPETLLESELFGSEKGAYTGATEQRKGFFEAADKGTMFLDELGEMPLGTQVKLLRVLESGEFSRLGSPDVLKTDVRIIAATNRRLEEEVAAGAFRTDLFYRLNSVRIEIPPLREHREDIPELIAYFGTRTALKNSANYEGISTEALELLANMPWAGNIRELRNLIETVVTLEKGRYITIESLRGYLPRALKQPSATLTADNAETLILPAVDEYVTTAARERPTFAALPPAPNTASTLALPYSPSSALFQISGKTPEQLERELVYKALVDLAREVALLRGEMAELKDAVLTQNHEEHSETTIVPRASTDQYHVSNDTADFPLTMHEVEKRLIGAALSRFEGNRRQTADALGISERTLYRKLREYGFVELGGEENVQ
jgi:transcriptional regulator with PAS, ATPase and Fis domain